MKFGKLKLNLSGFTLSVLNKQCHRQTGSECERLTGNVLSHPLLSLHLNCFSFISMVQLNVN